MIHLIATLKIKPGSRDKVFDLAWPCIVETRKEKGCISYDLCQSMTDPETMVFVERWESEEALQAHFKEPHLIAWRDAGAPYITDKEIEIIADGKVKLL